MIRRQTILLIALLIVGCASRPEIEMNILDGNISSGSTTLKTEDIIKDCKKECLTFTISSDEWCDCMHQCSQKVFDKISFGDMNVKIYIEECP